jgi:hypothetical protein
MREANYNRYVAEKSTTHWLWACVTRYLGRNSKIFRPALRTVQPAYSWLFSFNDNNNLHTGKGAFTVNLMLRDLLSVGNNLIT